MSRALIVDLNAPLRSWGVRPLRDGPDRWARDELVEHTEALCDQLHGVGDPARCDGCRTLLGRAS